MTEGKSYTVAAIDNGARVILEDRFATAHEAGEWMRRYVYDGQDAGGWDAIEVYRAERPHDTVALWERDQ